MLPTAAKSGLLKQVERVSQQHADDIERGAGWVTLPDALAPKYPHAGPASAGFFISGALQFCDGTTIARHYLPLAHPRQAHRALARAAVDMTEQDAIEWARKEGVEIERIEGSCEDRTDLDGRH